MNKLDYVSALYFGLLSVAVIDVFGISRVQTGACVQQVTGVWPSCLCCRRQVRSSKVSVLWPLECFSFLGPAVADLRGRPYGPTFSQFHAVFLKIWQNCVLAPRRVSACILNGSVRGRVSSSRKRFWTLPNLNSEVSA